MGIAVACDGLVIAPVFMCCSSYTYYEIQGNHAISCRNVPAIDQPASELPAFFKSIDADVLIAGQIDAAIVAMLAEQGITVITDCTGDPLQAVCDFLDGCEDVEDLNGVEIIDGLNGPEDFEDDFEDDDDF